MSNNKNREKVLEMFNNKKKKVSTYAIHIETGLPFAEITGYIREDEEAKQRHNKSLWEQKQAEEEGKILA